MPHQHGPPRHRGPGALHKTGVGTVTDNMAPKAPRGRSAGRRVVPCREAIEAPSTQVLRDRTARTRSQSSELLTSPLAQCRILAVSVRAGLW
jgi:hypothetical protein